MASLPAEGREDDGQQAEVTPEQILAWNEQLEGSDPDEIIRFACQRFAGRLAVATQFGVEGCTLLHRVSLVDPSTFVFTIDTGLLFEETYQLADKLEALFAIKIARIKPQLSVGQQGAVHGHNLWESDPDLCCTLRKINPMRDALSGKRAWMTALRRGQSKSRRNVPVVQWDERFRLVKFCPLAAQSEQEISDYAKQHTIPTNSLRPLGYTSLGCFPCTRTVDGDESGRDGRWPGQSKTECGLHG